MTNSSLMRTLPRDMITAHSHPIELQYSDRTNLMDPEVHRSHDGTGLALHLLDILATDPTHIYFNSFYTNICTHRRTHSQSGSLSTLANHALIPQHNYWVPDTLQTIPPLEITSGFASLNHGHEVVNWRSPQTNTTPSSATPNEPNGGMMIRRRHIRGQLHIHGSSLILQ